MSTIYPTRHRSSWPTISREVAALTLFCLLGLVISLAVFPRLDPDAAEFILRNLQ
jgi:hypothetical protein